MERNFYLKGKAIEFISESAKLIAQNEKNANILFSKDLQQKSIQWLKDEFAKDSTPIILQGLAKDVKTKDLKNGGVFNLEKYDITFIITPQERCIENSGIIRQRQYIYFIDNDTIVLSDDVQTGFYPRLKAILKYKNISFGDKY